MGMPDRDVEAGTFDQPGMVGMKNMDMGEMGMEEMPGMSHEKSMSMPASKGHGDHPGSRDEATHGRIRDNFEHKVDTWHSTKRLHIASNTL